MIRQFRSLLFLFKMYVSIKYLNLSKALGKVDHVVFAHHRFSLLFSIGIASLWRRNGWLAPYFVYCILPEEKKTYHPNMISM